MTCPVILYKDFFDPPNRPVGARPKLKEPIDSPVKTGGRVRFNDQVRVKILDKRKKGASDALRRGDAKKRKLETLDLDSLMAGDEDEDEGEDEDGEGGMAYGDGSEEDEDSLDDGDEEEDVDEPRRATIERSKDDLFAEENMAPAHGVQLFVQEKFMLTLSRPVNASKKNGRTPSAHFRTRVGKRWTQGLGPDGRGRFSETTTEFAARGIS